METIIMQVISRDIQVNVMLNIIFIIIAIYIEIRVFRYAFKISKFEQSNEEIIRLLKKIAGEPEEIQEPENEEEEN